MARGQLIGVEKSYGRVQVIRGADLDLPDGELIVFVGPSGCGKSTLLRMIAGLEDIDEGLFLLDGEPMNDVAPAKRGIAMVFQSYALYPHMTVRENLTFGLETQGLPRAQIDAAVLRASRTLRIEPLLGRKPRELSGGQRQRVAIGRAIVRQPRMFLFDEPLSNLDAELRQDMRVEIAKLQKELGTTMIYVTHDQVEAMTMADRIVVLREGLIEQVGTPIELYDHPANQFVGGFIGSPRMNFHPAMIAACHSLGALVSLTGTSTKFVVPVNTQELIEGEAVTLGVRPPNLRADGVGDAQISVELTLVEQLGGNALIYGRTETGVELVAQEPGHSQARRGERRAFGLLASQCHLFRKADGLAMRRIAA